MNTQEQFVKAALVVLLVVISFVSAEAQDAAVIHQKTERSNDSCEVPPWE